MTATAPAPIRTANDQVTYLHVNQLRESTTNPRRVFDAKSLAELAESIRQVGVLQPLLVRELPEGEQSHEVVAGARRFRAAKEAGLLEVPCFVRTLTDMQVLEAQFVENLQRADLHPLDEGLGYKKLHEEHGYSVDDLAGKLNKSKGYVYGRMQLAKLPAKVQTLFFEGEIDLSHAQLVARIPLPELAEKAAKDIARGHGQAKPMAYRAAVEHVRRTYQCDLRTAPFPQAAKELLPEAGACGACPKRTGNQKGLFEQPDDDRADVCTDPKCFAAKSRAFFDVQKRDVLERGGEVILGKTAREALYNHKFVDPESHDYSDPKHRTFSQRLGLKGKDLTPVLLQGRDGEAVLRWKRADVERALRGDEPAPAKGSKERGATARAETRIRGDQAVREKVEARRLVAVATVAEKLDARAALRIIVRDIAYNVPSVSVAKRRGLELRCVVGRTGTGQFTSAETREALEKMSLAELQGLALELICEGDPRVAEEIGVDEKDLARVAKQELKAQEKEAAKAAKKTPKAKEPKPAALDKKRRAGVLFALEHLKQNPSADVAEVLKAGRAAGVTIYPIEYGLAKAQLGGTKAKTKKAAKPRRAKKPAKAAAE